MYGGAIVVLVVAAGLVVVGLNEDDVFLTVVEVKERFSFCGGGVLVQ